MKVEMDIKNHEIVIYPETDFEEQCLKGFVLRKFTRKDPYLAWDSMKNRTVKRLAEGGMSSLSLNQS